MSAPVRDAVIAAILDHGPISFAEYMELALYGPGGYYEHPPVGAEGDFVTSPHVHPVFAELLAAAIRELWDTLGRPSPMRIAEIGAGDGTLAAGLLGADAIPPCEYTAVDRSPGARAALATMARVTVEGTLPRAAHLVLAHELLDNLPFRRVRMTEDGPREVRVGFDGDRLRDVVVDVDAGVARSAAGLEPGEETVIPDGAMAFVDELTDSIDHGYVLIIDYGAVGSSGGLTHGYRGHTVVADPLDDPGEADITSGVDFASIAGRAREGGLTAFDSVTQFDALVALGFEGWVRTELERQHRLLDERDGMEAVRAWSGRSRATLLVDPSALGRFRWLLLASPGLPAPSWLQQATEGPVH